MRYLSLAEVLELHRRIIVGSGVVSSLRDLSALESAAAQPRASFFQAPFVVSYDAAHSGAEPRWRALGRTVAGRMLFVAFTMRGTLIRVLAARDMNRKERRVYGEITTRTEKDAGLTRCYCSNGRGARRCLERVVRYLAVPALAAELER